ncbi:hypothetical protein Tco_0349103 [Tanacetum coccineum]
MFFFSQQSILCITTHDDEDLLQIDEDAMEEIDIRWQVAMITARIRKFMRKTGRPIDLKPKNGITFDKSKIELLTSIYYHLKELRCCAQCLIEDEDLSRDRDSFFLIVRHGGQFEYWKAGLVVVVYDL